MRIDAHPDTSSTNAIMTQTASDTNPSDAQQQLERFISWFRQLDGVDQQELMRLVTNEHKVREVVRTFSAMPQEQRQAVFHRLGLPNEILSRIPPPNATPIGDVEVEWKEWDSSQTH
jgi:Asp-tRNA(Asn)/Glu-tRNA(Gln) amidotransferase C subunit